MKTILHSNLLAVQVADTFGNKSATATALCKASGLTSSVCLTAQNYVLKAQEISNQFTKDSVACVGALDAYITGMLCFSCNTNATSYLNGNTVNIHTDTCTNAVSHCAPLNQDFLEYMSLMQQFSILIVSEKSDSLACYQYHLLIFSLNCRALVWESLSKIW